MSHDLQLQSIALPDVATLQAATAATVGLGDAAATAADDSDWCVGSAIALLCACVCACVCVPACAICPNLTCRTLQV